PRCENDDRRCLLLGRWHRGALRGGERRRRDDVRLQARDAAVWPGRVHRKGLRWAGDHVWRAAGGVAAGTGALWAPATQPVAGRASMMWKRDVVGVVPVSVKPALANSVLHSSRSRSRPPVMMSMLRSESASLAVLAAGSMMPSMMSTQPPGAIACRILRRISRDCSSEQS